MWCKSIAQWKMSWRKPHTVITCYPLDKRMSEILYGLGAIISYSDFTHEIGFHCALRACEIFNFFSQNLRKI